MPELPEVETIKRELEKVIIGKTFLKEEIYFSGCIKSNINEYSLENKKIQSLSREGKYLIIHLSDNKKLLFHMRMEGKLFVVDKEDHSLSHLSLFVPFKDCDMGLAFYDTRKFGVTYLLDEDEKGPLEKLGKEPFDMDVKSLYNQYHSSNKTIKELLLDQEIMSGLGNIYADEVLYAVKLSPFKKGKDITLEDCKNIKNESIRILSLAIENNGSTVRTYHAKEGMDGNFQNLLKVYSKQGKECFNCHHKIEKRYLKGRGCEYCPNCQKTGLNIAITGKIGSGKSLAMSFFKEAGFITFSSDEYVHSLYSNKDFLTSLKKEFPSLFTPNLNKTIITKKLLEDKKFKRKYQQKIFSLVRNAINDFIIKNDGKDKIFEVPLLFDSHIDKDFSIIVGIETNRQIEHLKERGDDISRRDFNELNSYDKNKEKLSYILHSDYSKENLKEQVKEVIRKIKSL